MPVIVFFIKVIDIASRPIEFLADVVGWLAGWISALGKMILYIITFQWGKIKSISTPGKFESEAFSRPLVDTGSFTTEAATPTGGAVEAGTTATGGTAQNYQVKNITVNVIINTDIITGDGGIPELVRIFYNETQRQLALGTI
jgi:hypothetical protein